MKKMLLIVNPISGKGKAGKYLPDMEERFKNAGYELKTVLTEKERNAYHIICEENEDYDVITCVGGDGTLKETATAIIEKEIDTPIGYVPMGSTNDFARSMNIPRGNVMAAVENIIEGTAKSVDIGRFNGENFIYIASFGNFTSSSYTASQKLKNAIGRTAYYLPIVKEFFHMKGFHARVEADGETFEDDWFVGGATNSYGVGGMPVLHNIGVEFDDGLHELVLVRMFKNVGEALSFIKAMATKDFINSPLVTIRHCDDIKFYFDTPTDFTLDGEFGGSLTYAEAKTLKHAVKIIVR